MKKNKRKHRESSSLNIVRQFFPYVDKVTDADDPILVVVTKADVNRADVKSHSTCALAVACRRTFRADGVIISLTTAYVVKGKTAVRYHLGNSISREITVFDRRGMFYEGRYQLVPASPSNRLGLERSYDPIRHAKNGGKKTKRFMHYTEGVRTSLTRLPAEKIMKTEIEKMKKQLK